MLKKKNKSFDTVVTKSRAHELRAMFNVNCVAKSKSDISDGRRKKVTSQDVNKPRGNLPCNI